MSEGNEGKGTGMIAKGYNETLTEETFVVSFYGTDAEAVVFESLIDQYTTGDRAVLVLIDELVSNIRARQAATK